MFVKMYTEVTYIKQIWYEHIDGYVILLLWDILESCLE